MGAITQEYNKRRIGTSHEELAASFLEKKGVRVLERNFRSRQGEIDLICRDGEYLVFVEVKYRRDAKKGSPEEAIGLAKQRKICKVAAFYRVLHQLSDDTAVRYDVIAIEGAEINWIQNAFPHRET